jgi:Stage II sporulation protein M
MSIERLVLVRGMADTRTILRGWQADPLPVLARWTALSLATCAAMLVAVLIVASAVTPDLTRLRFPPVSANPTMNDVWEIFGRNLLVLALHAMACVAGFMAGSSMPELAAARTGISRVVHEQAGRFAILFVVAATIFSLSTQAYVLGSITATIAAQFEVSPAVLLVGLLPHAIPELTALFLPLAAWTLASRRGEWNQLLAATFATTAIALPVLLLTALAEVYVSPHLIRPLLGL